MKYVKELQSLFTFEYLRTSQHITESAIKRQASINDFYDKHAPFLVSQFPKNREQGKALYT